MRNDSIPIQRMKLETSHVMTARLCAMFVLALGVTILTGWILAIPQIVQIRSQWTPMVVNTAIGFVLSGIALLAASLCRPWSTRIATLLAVMIMLLALEEWVVLAFNISPAFSLPDLHRSLQPGYPHPGRMAPNTALCFFIFGFGLWALMRSQRQAIDKWVQKAAFAIVAIGLIGMIGYALQLEFLYGWAGVTRMAVHTGFGMVVLGIGLWNLVWTHTKKSQITDGTEVSAAYRTASLLLLLVAASGCIGGFAFLQVQVEQQAREHLVQMAADRRLFFDQILEHRSLRAEVASDDFAPHLRQLADTSNKLALSAARNRASKLRSKGFSSVAAKVNGQYIQLDGMPAQSTLSVALRGDRPGWLLWQNGYVLQRKLQVRDDTGVVGSLITEQPLVALNTLSSESNKIGETGEMAICGADASTLHCFPLRSRAQPFNVPRTVAGQPLPMDYAIRGKVGAVIASDYRQHRVLAAYGPVGNTGLGIVIKRDIAEIYAPIREEFQRIVVFLGVLVLFGLWLLRLRLRPLLRTLEGSRASARADSARIQAAVESNLDAFYILECLRDSTGEIQDLRYVLLNKRGEYVIGRPRNDVVGRGLCELIPQYRSDGMLANCVHVVETGEPIVEERSAIVRQGRWYQLQMVKLGDGIGLTMRDITIERHAANKIRHQAMHDPLTGLTNRSGFELALEEAITDTQIRGHVVALAMLDLDGFKQINDSLGHAAGDQVLQEVANRLRACTRPADTAARLGGDEFVVVLPYINYPGGAQVVARKLVAEIVRPMQIAGKELVVSVSVGISACPQHGIDPAALLEHADSAMYRAKQAGRNGYAFYDALDS